MKESHHGKRPEIPVLPDRIGPETPVETLRTIYYRSLEEMDRGSPMSVLYQKTAELQAERTLTESDWLSVQRQIDRIDKRKNKSGFNGQWLGLLDEEASGYERTGQDIPSWIRAAGTFITDRWIGNIRRIKPQQEKQFLDKAVLIADCVSEIPEAAAKLSQDAAECAGIITLSVPSAEELTKAFPYIPPYVKSSRSVTIGEFPAEIRSFMEDADSHRTIRENCTAWMDILETSMRLGSVYPDWQDIRARTFDTLDGLDIGKINDEVIISILRLRHWFPEISGHAPKRWMRQLFLSVTTWEGRERLGNACVSYLLTDGRFNDALVLFDGMLGQVRNFLLLDYGLSDLVDHCDTAVKRHRLMEYFRRWQSVIPGIVDAMDDDPDSPHIIHAGRDDKEIHWPVYWQGKIQKNGYMDWDFTRFEPTYIACCDILHPAFVTPDYDITQVWHRAWQDHLIDAAAEGQGFPETADGLHPWRDLDYTGKWYRLLSILKRYPAESAAIGLPARMAREVRTLIDSYNRDHTDAYRNYITSTDLLAIHNNSLTDVIFPFI